jgi:sulfate adenylyltransferase subunit 1 (EFTu-like GTPase family)
MNAPRSDERGSAALVKFELGHPPGHVDLPPGRVVIAVDGMEKAGFEYEAFKAERSAFLRSNPPAPGTDMMFVPVSTHYGDMILRRGNHIDWYDGPTLAEALGV